MLTDNEGMLIVENLREQAHKELEIGRLMGPSDDREQAWVEYLAALVKLTDTYLKRVS